MRIALLSLAALTACGGSSPDPAAEPPVQCEGDEGPATELTVHPYVQSVTTDSAWVLWETPPLAVGSRVEYGPTDALGQVACGAVLPLNPESDPSLEPSDVHEVQLTGLQPDSLVYYRAITGGTASEIAHFRTAPTADQEKGFRLVAISDGQRDDRHPEKYAEIVNDGIIPVVRDLGSGDLASDLAMVVYPGDLVDNGWLFSDWTDFFADSAELLAHVPIFPVAGNHEANTPHYERYFHLPEDGKQEHYYTTDYSNLRLVGLDSVGPWDNQDQLVWLDGVLERTCDDPTIDFVFAQLHHPALSELWTPGESDWSAQVVASLEAFSTECGKPSIHFFGHTHGYSRGQSQEHQHLWVNVASAGGALDRWGEQPQADYDEFVASEDTYGFVLVEVQAGSDPWFRLDRISRGTPETPVDNELTDSLTIRLFNTPPDAPAAAGSPPTACSGPAVIEATPFSDLDGDAHQASHWQVAADCSGFDSPLVDRWKQRKNNYMGVDTQSQDQLTDEEFGELAAGQSACWRVRYRDDGLVWSSWSTPEAISLPTCP